MLYQSKNSNAHGIISRYSNKKSVLALATAAMALAMATGYSTIAKAEETCPTWTNSQILAPKWNQNYAAMTVETLLLNYIPKNCQTPILSIAHRGVHSYGMDFRLGSVWWRSADHASKVSVTPSSTTNRLLVDENTYMSWLIAAYRAKNGDVIPMRGTNYTVNVPWTTEDDAPNAIEVDLQKDKGGNWVAIHDSTIEREVGPAYAGLRVADANVKGIMRVYHPADFTAGKASRITWDTSTNPLFGQLYKVENPLDATFAQVKGGSKIFIQYHARSIRDLRDFHQDLLQRIYDWKRAAPAAEKPLFERAVQQFYYYMHIYDMQRLQTNGNFTDAGCGTRTNVGGAKNLRAIDCIGEIDKEVKRAEMRFLNANPGARAFIDTPKRVGVMTGMFQDTVEDLEIVPEMVAHRARISNRAVFMGLDISNNVVPSAQYPAYIDRWEKLMRNNAFQLSKTMNHPSHYQVTRVSATQFDIKWGFLRSGANIGFDQPSWSRHATHAIGLTPHGAQSIKPTMLVSDRHHNDRIGFEGNGWNWWYRFSL